MKRPHHAIRKRRHKTEFFREEASQAGFFNLSFSKNMNKNDKIIIISVIVGIILLLAASFANINKDKNDKEDIVALPEDEKRITTPYPTIPEQIKDTTVLINRRAITPVAITIKVNGTVGFLNEDNIPVTINGADNASALLNVGVIQPYDIPVVKFDKVGEYRYMNPQNPQEAAVIIVEE